MMTDFRLVRPATVDQAVAALADGAVPYAGGTELIAAMQLGLLQPPALVDLKPVPGLRGVTARDGEIVIGATTTHREIAASEQVRGHTALLARAATVLGNLRVRATGTIAGNVCFAEPRSDVLTALAALDARVTLRSATGQRAVPVTSFVEGAFTTVREETELLVSVHCPRTANPGSYARFQPAEYPTVAVAVTILPDGRCRTVVGAVGGSPQVFDTESPAAVDAAAIAERVEVIEDLNGAEDYKRHLTAVFIRRAIAGLRRDGA